MVADVEVEGAASRLCATSRFPRATRIWRRFERRSALIASSSIVAALYASMDWPSSASSASMSASTCCASAFLSSMRSAWAGTAPNSATPMATARRPPRVTRRPVERACVARNRGRTGRGRYVTGAGPYQPPGRVQREASRNCATKWLQNGNSFVCPRLSPLLCASSDTVTRRCGGNDQPRGLRSCSSPARSSGCPRRASPTTPGLRARGAELDAEQQARLFALESKLRRAESALADVESRLATLERERASSRRQLAHAEPRDRGAAARRSGACALHVGSARRHRSLSRRRDASRTRSRASTASTVPPMQRAVLDEAQAARIKAGCCGTRRRPARRAASRQGGGSSARWSSPERRQSA